MAAVVNCKEALSPKLTLPARTVQMREAVGNSMFIRLQHSLVRHNNTNQAPFTISKSWKLFESPTSPVNDVIEWATLTNE